MYMTYLAKAISVKQGLPIITDLEQTFSLSSSSFKEPDFCYDYREEFSSKLGNILIAHYIPRDIEDIPIERLLDLRERCAAERVRFVDHILSLCKSISKIESQATLEDALRHHGLLLIDQTKALKDAFDSNKIDTVKRFLGISVAVTLPMLESYIPINSKELGIGLLFGLAFSANMVKKEKNQLQASPLSYLLSVNSELSSERMLRRISDRISGIRKC